MLPASRSLFSFGCVAHFRVPFFTQQPPLLHESDYGFHYITPSADNNYTNLKLHMYAFGIRLPAP
jgi:hypothetical protein